MNAIGLDLSKWNGIGNWSNVKSAGVSFVVVKAGGIYSNTGSCYTDDLLSSHMAGAMSVNIPAMLYWYFLPFTPVLNQAQYFLELVADYAPDMPICVDVESTNGQAAKLLSAALKTFVTLLQGVGKKVVIYSRQSFWDVNVLADPLWKSCDLWASRWRSGLTSPWSDGSFIFRDWNSWRMWQHQGDGNARAHEFGFPGPPSGDPDIDINQFCGSESDFREWAGLVHLPTVEERLAALELAVFGNGR
jgi:lysozyme